VRWDAGGNVLELGNLGTAVDGTAFNRGLAINTAGQIAGAASKYVNGAYVRTPAVRWDAAGMPRVAQDKHLSILGNPAAMEAALAWYRARGAIRAPLGKIAVPTLYIWGDADDTVGRPAAEWTQEYVLAPYQFAVLPGGGHFTADQMPEAVNALLLAHLARFPL
jgi:pimeloyl-ACP methyl ester carboxylesterase